jgi:hypothetical protein
VTDSPATPIFSSVSTSASKAIDLDAEAIWQGFHWSFFIQIQALIICLQRFEQALDQGDLLNAKLELSTAATFLQASGAAMELAGSFSRQMYDQTIRPSMSPPQVQSLDFSGLMSWEHAYLIQVWKRLRPKFANLPIELEPTHQVFVAAYGELAQSHRAVCAKFGGDEAGSLRFDRSTATATLDAFSRSRLHLINPS